MPQDLSDLQLKDLWRQGKIPVIFKRNKSLPVLACIPFTEGNSEWLRDGRRLKPEWCAQFKAWEIPTVWFDSVIKLALRRHQEVYVIRLYREYQKCTPACWTLRAFIANAPARGRTTAMVIQAATGTRFLKPLPCPGAAALFMPPSEGQKPWALAVAVQAIGGRKYAETVKGYRSFASQIILPTVYSPVRQEGSLW